MSFFNYYSDPWADFRDMQRQMDRFASRFLQEPRSLESSADLKDEESNSGQLSRIGTGELSQTLVKWNPRIDVSENEKAITLHAELPGCSKEDIKLNIENNRLVLQGEKRTKKQEKGDNWIRRERVEGSFLRSMQLPRGVDASQIQANYNDGVLEVVIPKPENTVPKRQTIDIRTSSSSSSSSSSTSSSSQATSDSTDASATADKGKL